MRVIYGGRRTTRSPSMPNVEGDFIELFANTWDDYGYKTTFNTLCRIGGERVQLGGLRLLVGANATSSSVLDGLREDGWDGQFPLRGVDYLSVPSEITFYEQIIQLAGLETAIAVAVALRDASYLVHTIEDVPAVAMSQSQGFDVSLQRERGSIKAYLDGWKVIARQTMSVLDLGFRFRDVFGQASVLQLKFQTDGPLPHDINVLIGANGAGKSQVLHQIVADWIRNRDDDDDETLGFAQKPNLSQIVVLSYSPFERFPVDLLARPLQDQQAYRYFGFRSRSQSQTEGRLGGIKLSHEAPKRNAAVSLLDCVADDQRYRTLSGWAEKLETAEQVLRSAFDFDFMAVQIKETARRPIIGDPATRRSDVFDLDPEDSRYPGRYAAIRSATLQQIDLEVVRNHLLAAEGVFFFKDGEPIELSSGQKLFSFIVINILGAIRRESLLLIDEPELFLHPALEIQFIDMLKAILERFNSKALVATHSEVTVREVPSDCVHVLTRTEDGLVVHKPPFQTFGGDVQRISSYVFNDNTTSKPFERWIRDNLEKFGDADALLEELGDDVNEELVVQIRAIDSVRGADR